MLTVVPPRLMTPAYKLLAFKRLFGYTPHGVQLRIHASKARFRIVAAGARGGKSILGGVEAAYQLLFPGRHIWFVSSVYDLADKEFDWMLEFLGRAKWDDNFSFLDLCRLSNPSRGTRRIETLWGSWAETKSALKPETLLGEELDLHILGEASQMPQSAWDRQLYARLGPRQGGALLLSTPNWDSGFFSTLFERGKSERSEDSDYEHFQFKVTANPYFPVSEYDQAKLVLPELVFREQYDGEFVSRRGAVFPQFRPEVHVVTELPKGFESWPVLRGFHHEKNSFNNPISVVFVAMNPEDRSLLVFDETSRAQALVTDVCEEVAKKSKGRRIISSVTDYFNPTLRDALKKVLGRVTVNQEKKYSMKHAVVQRIQALQTLFNVSPPRILIHKDCEKVIEELEKAKWPDPVKEEREMAEKELPTTKFMGLPLALSYAVTFALQAQGIDVYQAQGLKKIAGVA